MLQNYHYEKFPYHPPADLQAEQPTRRQLVIIGAGPVGLAAAIDAQLQGLDVLVIDDDDTVSVGSRGLCYAKRTLEILDRLGCGDAIVNKGVEWNVGRTFFREAEVFNFNLLPVPDHKRPGMVNLQQYYLEEYLIQRARQLGVEIRWKNKLLSLLQHDTYCSLQIETPDGIYTLEAEWLLACDGARSPVRNQMGLEVEGKIFQDRFLIADVVMKADFPAERWFWFDPPFHPNQSVLLHREADNVWRIDFQLGWDADPVEEKKPENVIPRIKAMLGDEHEFELEWVSVYTFQCRRMEKFRHGRVLFAGDSAHQVSPFGARGANSGIQDADNLIWKLKLVMEGQAPDTLLDSYSDERVMAADENISNSTRSTDFITPKSAISKTFRNAVLTLAGQYPFARKLVNSGRLSVPSILWSSALTTADSDDFPDSCVPGSAMEDGPVIHQNTAGFLLDYTGMQFHGLYFCDALAEIPADHLQLMQRLKQLPVPVQTLIVSQHSADSDGNENCSTDHIHGVVLYDAKNLLQQRYAARAGSYYLIRPDQHIAARWHTPNEHHIKHALARVLCQHDAHL
ncbi:FAD-dependent oxidoreductase [Undibacterium sp. SXout7W]|uniref:FAD-dependent oxidoreductase n=1 Tax=Undibacterium sp. SXout7W TaxID=3413049 RepID=UPI003BEFC51D